VTNLPSLPNVPSRGSSPLRHRAPVLTLLGLALCALLVFAAAAGAEVVTVEGTTVGVAARSGATGPTKPETFANPEGNPVVHAEKDYVVYWDPTDHVHGDWQEGIDSFMRDVGFSSGMLSNNYSVLAQYDDKTNAHASYSDVYGGSYTDTHAYPANGCTDPNPFVKEDRIGPKETSVCLTAAQIATELQSFITASGLPKGMSTIYYVITPPGATVCLDGGGTEGHCSTYNEEGESYKHSFCSYHTDINPGGLATGDANTILYGVVPWDSAGEYADYHLAGADERPGRECQDGTADQEPNQIPCPDEFDGTCDHGLFDLIDNQLWLQQENIVTDPLLNSWQDADHAEAGDECRFRFGPTEGSEEVKGETLAGTLYNQTIDGMEDYLNDAFNLAGLRLPYPGVSCVKGTNLVAAFTAPNPANTGEVLAFDGMESNITQDAGINYPNGKTPAATYASYTWNFGDGTTLTGYAPGDPVCEEPWLSPCAASAFHTYTYGGTYDVTLTVTDVGGDTATIEHPVTVAGPPPPAPTPPAVAGGAGAAGATGSTNGSTSGGTSTVPVVNPIASASIISRSLKTALNKGLAVSYSVNEQVAGHFEVLIPSALAKKLKLHGTVINGLPGDIGPQVLIAKAIIVTTKAGRSTVKIRFSKAVAARLRHQHKLSLLLQMYVRDAASKTPATATVLSTITLAG
jgi:hypothetical protein